MIRSQKQSWKAFILLMALLAVLATGCRVRQTEEGELPDVDVNMPGEGDANDAEEKDDNRPPQE